ncbi:hypothetical protein DM01DRAFT_1338705 [Hesseltinella vesiculosa]|uniref:Uncharacterized protein n=1 Tax=Hesseltinella vesiculosa TaxID=101127 RepID=A0A1X2G953_9FUNG|nr:hypothetical protein DM01DRAFT_1338705 [Hesseltinella vesiculosa]
MAWLVNNNSPPPTQGSGAQGNGSQGSSPDNDSSSLSVSDIAGIAVGSVVAVLGVIGAFVLWYIGKNKNRQLISEALETDPRNELLEQQQDIDTDSPEGAAVVSDNQGLPAKSKPLEGSPIPSQDRAKPFESPEKPFEAHTQSNEASDKPVEWSTKPFEGLNKPFGRDPSQAK